MSTQPESYNEVSNDGDVHNALGLFFGLSPIAVLWGGAVWLVGWLFLY